MSKAFRLVLTFKPWEFLKNTKNTPIYRSMGTSTSYRVIIAEDDGQLSHRLGDFLVQRGFEVEYAKLEDDVLSMCQDYKPHFVVMNIVFGQLSAANFIREIRNSEDLKRTKVFVTSAHNSLANVQQVLREGAADYIVKPYEVEEIISRLVFHVQKKRKVKEVEEDKTSIQEGGKILHLLDLVLKECISEKKKQTILFNHTKMLALTLKAVRINIIQCSEDRQIGYVIVSSDDKALHGLQINLNKYPEVLHVMNTEKMVVLENLAEDPTMKKILQNLKNVSFNSMIVAPLWKQGKFFGVISARMPKEYSEFTDGDIRFTQLLSLATSAVLSSDFTGECDFISKKTA